jgi:hypothetical protein
LELLLNLLWLLLAVPAVWVWRQAKCVQPGCPAHSRRNLLLIACIVLLLFPIISASDDLQAMRPEVEEATSRDTQRPAQGHRQAPHLVMTGALAVPARPSFFVTDFACVGSVAALFVRESLAPSHPTTTGRAPPASFPG